MVKMVCDRCGKVVEGAVVKLSYYSTANWEHMYKPSIRSTSSRLSEAYEISEVSVTKDLCEDCTKLLSAFLNELKENDDTLEEDTNNDEE